VVWVEALVVKFGALAWGGETARAFILENFLKSLDKCEIMCYYVVVFGLVF
jgi:hypothetical protein